MVGFDLSDEICSLSSSLSTLWLAIMSWSFEFEKRCEIFRSDWIQQGDLGSIDGMVGKGVSLVLVIGIDGQSWDQWPKLRD